MENKEELLTEAVDRFKELVDYNYESKGFAEIDPEKLIIKEVEEVSKIIDNNTELNEAVPPRPPKPGPQKS